MESQSETTFPDFELIGASVVHDFNNFLTPIASLMSELQRDCSLTRRQLEKIDGAIICTLRARALAYQLLDLSRFCRVDNEVVDLGTLLSPLEAVYATMLGPAIQVTLEIPDDLPLVKLDPFLMERALLNLILNARNAMYDGGQLVISASLERSLDAEITMVCVTVKDTGQCLKVEPVPNSSDHSARMPRGNGLGLAMVTRFVTGLGGQVTVVRDPECGTAVSLWLPPLFGLRPSHLQEDGLPQSGKHGAGGE